MSGRPAGFTLMEMLVVLLIAGLLAGLLFSALQSLATGNARLADRSATSAREALARQWWLESTAAFVADRREAFSGNESRFSGLATRDLQGLPVQARGGWRVDGPARDRLAFEMPGAMAPAIEPGAGGLRFAYLDIEGRMHAVWPPAQGLQAALPEAVVLLADEGGTQTVAVARVVQPRLARVQPFSRELGE